MTQYDSICLKVPFPGLNYEKNQKRKFWANCQLFNLRKDALDKKQQKIAYLVAMNICDTPACQLPLYITSPCYTEYLKDSFLPSLFHLRCACNLIRLFVCLFHPPHPVFLFLFCNLPPVVFVHKRMPYTASQYTFWCNHILYSIGYWSRLIAD